MIYGTMSNIIKFDLKELKQLVNDKKSCINEKTVTQNLTVDSWCLGNLKESIKRIIDLKVGKYVKELNGILISYKNLRILQNAGAKRNDNSNIIFQIQADYFIFQPYIGATLKGIVIKKYITHLALLLHRVFNVTIPRPTEEHDKTWTGLKIQENQEVVFKVAMLDLYGALPYIRGELVERWIKFGQGGDDEAVELSHNNINNQCQQQFHEKLVPLTRNLNAPGKLSTKNNTYDSKAVENEVNPHSKSKSKRHK